MQCKRLVGSYKLKVPEEIRVSTMNALLWEKLHQCPIFRSVLIASKGKRLLHSTYACKPGSRPIFETGLNFFDKDAHSKPFPGGNLLGSQLEYMRYFVLEEMEEAKNSAQPLCLYCGSRDHNTKTCDKKDGETCSVCELHGHDDSSCSLKNNPLFKKYNDRLKSLKDDVSCGGAPKSPSPNHSNLSLIHI